MEVGFTHPRVTSICYVVLRNPPGAHSVHCPCLFRALQRCCVAFVLTCMRSITNKNQLGTAPLINHPRQHHHEIRSNQYCRKSNGVLHIRFFLALAFHIVGGAHPNAHWLRPRYMTSSTCKTCSTAVHGTLEEIIAIDMCAAVTLRCHTLQLNFDGRG